MSAFRISNIVKQTSHIQSLMSINKVQAASQSFQTFQVLEKEIKKRLISSANSIDQIFSKQKKTPADLAVRSRRAYQWIKFLVAGSNLPAHLDALQRINLYCSTIDFRPNIKKDLVDFSFYHIGSLYNIQSKNKRLEITAQECFITAPDKVFIALLDTSFGKRSPESKQLIRDYTFSPTYQQARKKLEYLGIPTDSFTQGEIHNLLDSFSRVNEIYFANQMEKPRLVWNDRLTYRKFGHYQWDTDTVMVSRSLDHSRVPSYVVDYVMYHELLHKKLGAKLVNQHRVAHTSTFRQLEEEFKQTKKARSLLAKLARKKS